MSPWNRVFFLKSLVPWLSKFPTLYGNWWFITTFTRACHLSLSWAPSTQFTLSQLISLRPITALPSHLCLGLPSGLLLWFPHQNPVCTSYLCMYHVPCLSHSSWFDHLDYLVRDTDQDVYYWVSSIPSFLIPLSTLFLKILSLCSSLNVRY